MELPPISASLGAMVSLEGKLDVLQLDSELRDELQKLKSRLLKLSKAPDPPATVCTWMNDVRELSYDMDNCVDAGEDWFDQMPGFKACVKEANGLYDRYIFESVPSPTDVVPIADRQLLTVDSDRNQTDLAVGLYGTGAPVDKLCNLLIDGDEQLKVLSILGVGGIGKTRLAKELWRKNKPGDHFHCRAFVRSAKKPDMRRMLRSILAQVRPHQPPDANEVHELIHDLNEHLKDKRYFLIIDDLWTKSVWDIARRAFPKGNHGSRIVITTEVEDVALAFRSRYPPGYIFQMEPLSDSHAKELFTSAVFRPGEQLSPQLKEVSDEIIRRCDGLPQAIISISSVLVNQGKEYTVQKWEQILNSLPANTTSAEILKQVVKFCYSCLPSCLRTCLLYLSLYPENYVILKEDIVKQWVAEGFIHAPTENDKMKVAETYFDKLVSMGLLQHIDVDYSDEALYYAVPHMVHDLITSKSMEENFVTVIDYSQRTVRFSNKVSRLSLQFGSATYATKPEIIGLQQVRSLAFIGLKSCLPSILEFKLLRFLTLHIWSDQPNTGVDLKHTSELVLLRSLQVTCNDTVHLPDLMQGPLHLETLEVNARVPDIPANIVHLRGWLHLRLGVGTEQPDVTGILKTITMNPPISLDDSSIPPTSVITINLLPPISKIPKWVGHLTNLAILKFVVRELQRDDISNLHGLTFLTVFSLHVQRRTRELIIFAKDAFTALEYFEFRCGVLRLLFQEGTMLNLRRLGLGFNARRGEQYDRLLVGVEDLLSIQKISVLIGSATGAEETDLKDAESAFKEAIGKHSSKVSVKRVDMVEEEYDLPEKQHLVQEKDSSSEQQGIPTQKFLEDIKKTAITDSQFIQRIRGWNLGHRDPAEAQVDQGVDPDPRSRKENTPEHTRNVSNKLPFRYIKQITNNFDKELGHGTFGSVYKGVSEHAGEIAVKVLHNTSGTCDGAKFQREFNNLKALKHENIVELVGFCDELEEEPIEIDAMQITAYRVALCVKYVQHGGLNNHISDEQTGLDWPKRYRIIRGVSEGLKYLLEGLEHPIIHLDLKPENILLDKNMVAKISDFGLSKLIGEENTRKTMSTVGTRGYWPPEYVKHQIISKEFDIFSFGVIVVKIMVGSESYNTVVQMTKRQFVKHVHDRWKTRLHETISSHELREAYCNQVKRCIEIALDCLNSNRQERPTIQYIVSNLTETDICDEGMQNEQDDGDSSTLLSDIRRTTINTRPSETSCLDLLDSEDKVLLHVQPLELCFMPQLKIVPRKQAMISCLLQLKNKENDRVAFMLVANNPKRYLTKKPLCDVVPSRCVYTLSLTMPKKQPPPTSDSGDFFTLYSGVVGMGTYDLCNDDKDSAYATYDKFFKNSKVKMVGSEMVRKVTLKASIFDQPADQGTASCSEVITIPDAQQVSSIDVHPTEPWIMTRNRVGTIRVWNYNTMTTLDSFDFEEYEPVGAARFIAQEKWVIVGGENGYIHVYNYDQNQGVKSFDGHDSCIRTLVVHPTKPFVLSLSDDDDKPLIKLWNWENDWECAREFVGHDKKVTHVRINPEDTDSFASVSMDGTIKIWSISSKDPSNVKTLNLDPAVRLLCVDYFTRNNQQHLIVGCKDRTAQIWKLGTTGMVHKLEGHTNEIVAVNFYPELGLLFTGSLDGTIRVWNSTTYKLDNIICFNLKELYAFGFIKGSRRIIAGCFGGISMMEISSP